MSELRKWRVTGPDGFKAEVALLDHPGHDSDIAIVHALRDFSYVALARAAGYRAEPIEPEPKMVTVRVDDAVLLLSLASRAITLAREKDSANRVQAALKDAK